MTNHLLRNAVCLLVLLGLACGITGLYQQQEAIRVERTPHWVIIEGGGDEVHDIARR